MIRARQDTTANTFVTGRRFEQKFTAVVNGIGQEVARELQPTVTAAFAEPGPVVYPIEWTSERQRRAFFATDGFGRGIPTVRTGKVAQAWTIRWIARRDGLGGAVALENDTPYARYVYGGFRRGNTFQQRFHKNTGWANALEQSNIILTQSATLTEQKFDEALGAFGFVETRGGRR